jgi:hypothetical protein
VRTRAKKKKKKKNHFFFSNSFFFYSTTVTHKFTTSGLCRSIDHEEAIESLACDPGVGRELHVRLHAGASLPESWQVGTVLIGSAEWKCAHAGAPAHDGRRSAAARGRVRADGAAHCRDGARRADALL